MRRGVCALCRSAPLLLLLLLPRAPSLALPAGAQAGGFEGGYHANIPDLAYVQRTYYFISDNPLQWDRNSLRMFRDDCGRLVRTLFRGAASDGEHETSWDGLNEERRPMPSGVYFARIEAGVVSDSRALVLLR